MGPRGSSTRSWKCFETTICKAKYITRRQITSSLSKTNEWSCCMGRLEQGKPRSQSFFQGTVAIRVGTLTQVTCGRLRLCWRVSRMPWQLTATSINLAAGKHPSLAASLLTKSMESLQAWRERHLPVIRHLHPKASHKWYKFFRTACSIQLVSTTRLLTLTWMIWTMIRMTRAQPMRWTIK